MASALSLQGRMRRRDWWLIQLIVTALQMLAAAALSSFGAALYVTPAFAGLTASSLIELAIAVVLLCPVLIANVRRAHDRNRSGRWAVAAQLAAFGLSFVAFPPNGVPDFTSPQGVFAITAITLCGLYLLFGLGVPDGTPGPNRFGPSPKSGQV